MATYREVVYMALDELKLISNDATYTPEHLIFLADNYRALLLDRRYRDARKGEVTRSNYQEICLDLIEVPAIPGTSCAGVYLRSTKKMPSVMNIGIKHIYPVDYFTSEHISYIPLERMPYVGNNKWLSNIIYVTKGPDDYLYLKSSNPQFLYLKKLRIDAVFQNAQEVAAFACSAQSEGNCDILDSEFPLEDTLISPLIQMMVQELSGAGYLPTDKQNNASDDMSGMMRINPKTTKSTKTEEE